MAGDAGRDFFISYTAMDRPWAEWIAVQLEQAGYSTVLQAFDFRPGSDFVHQMNAATSSAGRTIAVLSPAYFASAFSEAEWRTAFTMDPSGDQGLLVPVRVLECRPPGLLATRVYVDLVDADEATCRRVLLDAVNRDRVRPTTAPFPGPDASGSTRPLGRFPGSGPEINNLPPRNPHFTGRGALLEQLHQRLRSAPGTTVVQALFGLGGVGKTQLAIEYAHRYTADYDLVWWINAQRPVLIPDELAALATRLDLPASATATATVNRVLTELDRRTRWLLIFDNAERPADIAGYQPRGPGHLLVTSRFPGWGAMGGRVEVDVLDRRDTVDLLRGRIPEMTAETADQLAAELGDLPLAAAQAAGYLEQTALPAADYLHRFRAHRAGLLASGDVLGYEGRLDTAWAIALQRLQTDHPAAVDLLELAAYLAPEPIPLALFTDHTELLEDPLHRILRDDPDALADVVGELVGYSLVRRHQDDFQLHRLVQAVIRNQIPPTRRDHLAATAVALLAAAYPGDPNDPASWTDYTRLAPHVLTTGQFADNNTDSRRLMLAVVGYFTFFDPRTSRTIAENLRTRWSLILGPDHIDTLTAEAHLTAALTMLAELAHARDVGRDAPHRARSGLGADHPVTLRLATNLANALTWLGPNEQTIGPTSGFDSPTTDNLRILTEDTLERTLRTLGPDHTTTLSISLVSITQRTMTLVGHADAPSVRLTCEDTLEHSRNVLGPDHAITLGLAANLTLILALEGSTERALNVGAVTLARARNLLGPNHLMTLALSAILSVALILHDDDVAQALDLAQDTLERCRDRIGPDHRVTRLAAAATATSLAKLGATEHAYTLGRDALTQSRFGPNDPITTALAHTLNAPPNGPGSITGGSPPTTSTPAPSPDGDHGT